ncbi:MAG: AmmeMemoRadiSam system protein B [Candidatus Omnitrophica bacterium]|nr:AmmeMemoRadiSam system protein B [Candidatus Omnitrophota bacterium]
MIFITMVMVSMSTFSFGNPIKEPNVSGQFYPSDPTKLSTQIDQFLEAASLPPTDKPIAMVIAPHAGYMYSGGVAAHSFKAVRGYPYKTIVILAPSHDSRFQSISIWPQGGFRTPLGVVPVDEDFAKNLVGQHEKFVFDPQAYAREHSLEVEIPFLQKVFKDFKIVPVVMGQTTPQVLDLFAQKLSEGIGDRDDVLIVVSTDLSHYHPDSEARPMDQKTIQAIQNLQAQEAWNKCVTGEMEMCGFVPVTTALLLAKKRGWTDVEVLKYATSGDVTGDKSQVVGYSSVVFYKENFQGVSTLTVAQKKRLLEIARKTMDEYVRTGRILEFEETDPRLLQKEGAFVTLYSKAHELRGCIGRIISEQPLHLTVRDMAIAAATEDPRFKPVDPSELSEINLEVSVLSQPRPIQSIEEIEVGKHGVILSRDGRQGVFLPEVATEWGWEREELLSQLASHKAGLPADAWKDPRTRIEIFSTEKFTEK